LILDEKLLFIMNSLKIGKNASNLCFEWWNYSNFCELKDKFDMYFNTNKDLIFKDANKLEILSIILIYEICFDKNFSSLSKMLYNLMISLYQNFLLVSDSFCCKMGNGTPQFQKLVSIIKEKLNLNLKTGELSNLIRKNNTNIFNCIRELVEIYDDKDLTDCYTDFLSNLQSTLFTKINEYFKELVSKKGSSNSSISIDLSENYNSNKSKNLKKNVPFIKTKPRKQYTLLIDLDETLIHLKLTDENLKGVVTFRPFLYEFLDEMYKHYELVIFTCGTVDYADPIINLIESKRTYFDHRLYRDNTSIINGEYVKDLSLVGRDLSKTLILDNLPQNFRLQKQNGIFIKAFYNENPNDNSLNELLPILKKIAQSESDDIRKELSKFKNDILKKISTSISNKQTKFSLMNKLI